MANADFEQNTPRGGFDAASYQAARAETSARRLTPAQQKLAGLEAKLPGALQSRAMAGFVAAIALAAAVFGFGGAKLNAKYRAVENAVTVGVAADTQYSSAYTLSALLTDRVNYAASATDAAADTLGADNRYLAAAKQALSELDAARESGSVHEMYVADTALEAAVDAVYAEVQNQAQKPMDLGTLQNAYTNYNAAGRVLDSLHYNELAQDYNDSTGGLADLVGTLWGCGKAELFA